MDTPCPDPKPGRFRCLGAGSIWLFPECAAQAAANPALRRKCAQPQSQRREQRTAERGFQVPPSTLPTAEYGYHPTAAIQLRDAQAACFADEPRWFGASREARLPRSAAEPAAPRAAPRA